MYKQMKNDYNKKRKAFSKSFVIAFSVLLAAVLLFSLTGCSGSALKKKGRQLYMAGDYDKAVTYLEREHFRHPKNSEIKTMLYRSKLKSYQQHLTLARYNREVGRKEEAIKEYKFAIAIFPRNNKLEEELQDYIDEGKKRADRFKSFIVPPVALNVNPEEKISIKLPAAPVKKIFNILGKSFNVNIVFDKDFRDFPYSLEIDNIGFYDILNQLCMVSSCRYRVLDSASVLIYPDTTFKRRTFDLQGVKVFYLSNIDVEEAKKLLMTIFRDQRIQAQEDKNLNSIIIKADSDTLLEIEKFLYNIDKGKSEVEVDVEILEVNRNIVNALGADFSTPLASIAAGTVGSDGKINSTFNVNDLDSMNFFLTIPTAALNFLESDDNTKIISKPNLRGVDGEEISFMVGEERPVPQTSFQSYAAGGAATIPMTTYQYKNVGVTVKITPQVHNNNEVTLKVKLTLNFVIGMVDNFPVLGKRELENIIRLKEGETNIIGGFIRDEIRDTTSGLAGLSKIPILGKVFGSNKKEIKQSDIVFSITPRVIRKIDVTLDNQKTIWTNMQNAPQGGGPLIETEPRGPEENNNESGNSIRIAPSNRTLRPDQFAYFTIRLNTTVELSSISLSGSVDGPRVTIEDLKTDYLRTPSVKVFKNHTANAFDIGYSNLEGAPKSSILGQIRIKFHERGQYNIIVSNTAAQDKEGKPVTIESYAAEVTVEEVPASSDVKNPPERREINPEEERREREQQQVSPAEREREGQGQGEQ